MSETLRPDLLAIADLIEANTRVLDIGCGGGSLMKHLEQTRSVQAQGIEIDAARVAKALEHGLSVMLGDADNDLQDYPENAFDVVILAQTLQAMKHPKEVLEECLRIGERVIVAIPNFGHLRNRWYLLKRGRMPVTSKLSYQWYETPNIHFCTVKDMLVLCEELGATVETRLQLDAGGKARPFHGYGHFGANLFAELGLFVLKRN